MNTATAQRDASPLASLKHGYSAKCGSSERVVPRLMRYRDISAAVDATFGVEEDPLWDYLRDTPDKHSSRLHKVLERVSMYLDWCRDVRHQVAWTIHDDSFLVSLHTRDDPRRWNGPVDKVLAGLARGIDKLIRTKQQKQRWALFKKVEDAAIERTLGQRTQSLLYISNVITVPECQGRGYASALIRRATNLADTQGRGSWLLSSNIKNEGFYNLLGFYTVYRFTLGSDDPTWDGPPIPMDIMVREPLEDVLRLSEKAGAVWS